MAVLGVGLEEQLPQQAGGGLQNLLTLQGVSVVQKAGREAHALCLPPFGVDKLGDEEGVAAITPESLWERYQALLREAQVEVYYCGSTASPARS